ncbi:hypothetical protein ACIP4X_32535 [Streptomyces sp. NPDC088817]|uniref:hypothetical protein n=1 Tax=unclassified Streptomyces TaxID=2593676 RepID=UPI0036EADFB9
MVGDTLPYPRNRASVTGGAGFPGPHLCERPVPHAPDPGALPAGVPAPRGIRAEAARVH